MLVNNNNNIFWIFRDSSHNPTNWGGYMQNVCIGEHPPSATIQRLPILDLNPSNETCIYSTLLFVQEQVEQLSIVTPCVTFDQPLYIKAVDIVKSATLNVVFVLEAFILF